MKKFLINYIEENFKMLKMLFIFILIGIVLGIIFYNVIPNDIKNDIINSYRVTLDLCKENNFEKINIILNGSINNLILIFIIYISSLLIISPQMSLLISCVKGTSIGFYAINLLQIFGMKNGIIAILCLLVVPNLVYLPTFVFTLINSVNFHYLIINRKIALNNLIKEIYNVVISISLIFLSIVLEQTMCNIIINIWKNI